MKPQLQIPFKNLHVPTGKSPNVIFALTRHGGHMGFFEGKLLLPHPLTWMDRTIIQYADAIYKWQSSDQRLTPAGEQQNCNSAELNCSSSQPLEHCL